MRKLLLWLIVAWISVASAAQTVVSPSTSAAKAGYDSGKVESIAENPTPLANYTALRAYTGRATSVRITSSSLAGYFTQGASATDNGGSVINDRSGRSWHRVFTGPVDVMWFDTKGDGITDDTAALNAAAMAAAGQAILHVPAGTYLVDGTNNSIAGGPTTGGWKLPSKTHVIMAPGAVIKVKDNALAGYTAILIADADDVSINGGHVVGDRTNHTYNNVFDTLAGLNAGVYRTKRINDGASAFADGETAYVSADAGNSGTYRKTSGRWNKTSQSLPNYYTHEFGFGVEVVGSTNVMIEGMVLKDFTGDGAIVMNRSVAKPATNVRFVGNTFDSDRRQGVSLIGGKAIEVRGNFFNNIGIRVKNQDGTAPRAGVDIESGGATKADGVIVSGNVFRGCTIGVSQFDGDNVTISGNQIDGAAGGGISYGYGVNTAIIGNSLTGSGLTGVGPRTPIPMTYANASGVVTVNTGATPHPYSARDSVYLELQDANDLPAKAGVYTVATVPNAYELTVNIASGVPLAKGHGFMKYTSNNVTISGNTIQGGFIYAVGKLLNITDNTVWNCGPYGINVAATAADVSVARNVVNNCGTGINVTSGAADVTIGNNQIYGASTTGISSSGSKVLISGNKVRYSKQGIRTSAGSNVIQSNYINIGDYPGASSAIQIGGTATDVIDNQVEAHTGTAFFSQAPGRFINNKITNHAGLIGIQVTGAASDGSTFIGNVVEFKRSTTSTSIGISVSNNTKARLISNVIYGVNAAPLRGIDTAASVSSTLTNNVYQGALNTASSDTLNANVRY
jgi:hypothetical protein